jgi:adenylate cyclase
MDLRAQNTVLFADLSGCKTLSETVGPTKASETITSYFDLLQELTRTRGGRVVKSGGEEMIATFPAAEAAADAASAMQAAIGELPVFARSTLGVRIAFHSGDVSVLHGHVLGAAARLAAQLVEQAKNAQIITSSGTAAALGKSYEDRIRAAQTGVCELVWSRPAAHPPAQESLRLKYGRTEVAPQWPANGFFRIGRDLDCGLVIVANHVSRRHCTIQRRDDEYVVIDHSTNGTYVTDDRAAEVELQDSEMRIGKHGWLAIGQSRASSKEIVEYFFT